ncbi:hypothetical protein [Saccharopolyspora rosea]|uniref:Uncharacterized protein n=1 Tax=Saccharopolyspora rosea TaxID=524884 RepID=A0ABW3FK55_9PSEU|nr:hypothetical protein [Saccharopolyspora rosea]
METGYWDKFGTSIDLMTWADLFADLDYRYVGKSQIRENGNVHTVGTIWLGHVLDPREPAHIFETALFPANDRCRVLRRYPSLDDAERGHRETVDDLAARHPGAEVVDVAADADLRLA